MCPAAKQLLILLPLLVGAVLLGSCGRLPTVTCNLVTGGVHVCTVYALPDAAAVTSEEAACKVASGTVLPECPSADLLGTCSVTIRGVAAVVHEYSSDGRFTLSEVEESCATSYGSPGVFTPAR